MEGYWFVLPTVPASLYLSHTEDASLGYNSIIKPVCLYSIALSLERMDVVAAITEAPSGHEIKPE